MGRTRARLTQMGGVLGLASGLACADPALEHGEDVTVVQAVIDEGPAESVAEITEMLELLPETPAPLQAVDEPRPLVVVLHGRGGRAHRFARRFGRLQPNARVIALEGPWGSDQGRAWLSPEARRGPDQLKAAELAAAGDELATTLATLQDHYPTSGRPILVGYSQGGMVALAAAARHPEAMSRVVAVAARLPEGIAPAPAGADAPAIELFHGKTDEVVPFRQGLQTATRLRDAGYAVRFRRLNGVPHRVGGRHWKRIVAELGRELGQQRVVRT